MKGKKLLTGLLSAAMVLGSVAVPVFADGEVTTLPTADENGVITLTENVTLEGSFDISNSIDLNEHSLTINGITSVIKNGIIKNGTIKVAQNASSSETMLRIGDYSNQSLEVEMTDVIIEATEAYTAPCGLLGIYQESKLTLNNVTINVGSNDGTAVIYGNDQKADLIANNIKITAVNQNKLIYGVKDADIKDMTFKGKINKELFSVVGGKVENSTFTYTNAENEDSRSIASDAGLEKELTFINTKIENAPTFKKGAINNTNESSKVVADEQSTVNNNKMTGVEGVKSAVAKIGDTLYTTLEEAVKAAQDGDTVKLLCDANGNGIAISKDLTIDFNGFSYTIDGILVGSPGSETNCFQLLAGADTANPVNITFKNGTIISSKVAKWGPNTKNTANTTGANIIIQNYSNLTLNNMTIDGDQTNQTEGNPGAYYAQYVLSNNNGNTVLTGNTNIIAAPGKYAFDVCRYSSYPGVIVTLDDNMTGTIIGNIEISNSDKAGNTVIPPVSNDKFNLIIKAGNIDGKISDARTATQKAAYAKIGAISGGTFKTDVSEFCEEGYSPKLVNGKYVVDDSADTIDLKFVPTSDKRVYDIVLSGNNRDINRLNAAEFTFSLDTTDKITYEIAAAEKMSLIPAPSNINKYEFHFDGKDSIGDADTATEIKIGTVAFDGFGTFKFGATAGKVTATTVADNLVTEFVTVAETGKGTLKISEDANKITETISVPQHKLTINIAMNHKVTDNETAYQNMTVEISGGNLGTNTKKYALGIGGTELNNGIYTITADLDENGLYTVTVKGAGYRTARYTVALTGEKTMYLWNNVMTAPTIVVDDVDATTNFLAGDIVRDGIINIYDLSAVVAYFGTNNLVSEHKDYAKYDLNRDGKIDMMDISIVLTSWNN